MDIKDMNMEQVEARISEMQAELETEGADIEKLNAEFEELRSRKEAIRQEAQEKRTLLDKIANSKEEPIAKMEERKETNMETIEVRNTPEYIEAYAKYIKTGDASECRAALKTENASGTIAVPELVWDTVKTAWNRDGVMALVRKAYLKGNLKVGFEISSSEAVAHTEGTAVDEESLVLGVVNLVPQAIKKWISISDEALDMSAVPYLQYIYDELTYRIAKKAADTLIAKIVASPATSTTTAPSVAVHTSTTITVGLVAQAMAKLSDEAANPVIIMNKATWGAFKAAQAANGYNYDPFEGLPVVFNNSLTAFSAATTGVAYAIVGDLGQGALANFPAGEEIQIKRDDYTLATSDLVRFIGREYVALGVVAPDAFCVIKH
jgi:HK97 family phage major capsid protein